MKIIITDSNFKTDHPERGVLRQINAGVFRHQCVTEKDVLTVAADADGLLVQFAPITRQVIEGLRKCKVIVRYGIGVDNVDLEAAKEHNIKVCNVPSYCLDEVADHTAALILTLSRKILFLDESVKRGEWQVEGVARPLIKPSEAVIGLIGLGRIGERVAKRLQAFQFNVAAYDPYTSDSKMAQLSIQRADDLQTLLQQSDFVSLHVPLTEETKGMINEQTIKYMKRTAFVVNTSRGALVDTVALSGAINKGHIAGAALDVYEQEPLPSDHSLRTCERVILTPHAAYYSETSIIELQRQAAMEVVRYFTYQPLLSPVN